MYRKEEQVVATARNWRGFVFIKYFDLVLLLSVPFGAVTRKPICGVSFRCGP